MIVLSNNTVAADAPPGTVVGSFAESVGSVSQYYLLYNQNGMFSISGDNLVTAWNGTVEPGRYPIVVLAGGLGLFFIDFGLFFITVEAPKATTVGVDLKNISVKPQPTPTKPGP